MLDVGWTEILVIAIVLIVVVGPKDLPHMLRQFGRTTAKMRAMAGDFRKQFDEALKEAELDDVRDLANQARGLDPRQTIRKHLNPIEKAGQDIKAGLDAAMKPKADSSAEAASTAVHAAEPAKTGAVGKPKATNGAGKSRKAAPKKRATAKGADAKAAATRTKTARSSNGNGSGKAKVDAVAPAKRAVKSPVAKPKAASATARKTRSASAAGKKPDKPGSAT